MSTEENTQQNWLQTFMEKAEESTERSGVSGQFAKVRLATGFYVYGTDENQFFAGGTSEAENNSAYNDANAHAVALDAKSPVFAFQLTIYGGTHYPEPRTYETDDGNLTRLILNFSSRHPVTGEWDNPGVNWKTMLESFEGDNPVDPKLMSGDFWAHVANRPHPYFDENDPETHVRFVAQMEDDEVRLNDEGKPAPEYLTTIKAAFATEQELIDYAYSLGLVDESTAPASVDAPPPAQMWGDVDLKEWASIWNEEVRPLMEQADLTAEKLLPKQKILVKKLADLGVEPTDFEDLYSWMESNPVE